MLQTFCPTPQPVKVGSAHLPFAVTPPRYALGQAVISRNITEDSFDTGDPDLYVWYDETAIVAGFEWNWDYSRWDYALYYPEHHKQGHRMPVQYDVPEDELHPQ